MAEKRDDETILLSGQRVRKDDVRLEACGMIDELSSILGVVRAFLRDGDEVSEALLKIQEHLFILGSQISALGSERSCQKIEETHVKYLDDLIREYEKKLPKLAHFIYPGGAPAGALLHLARAVARRVERMLVALSRRFQLDLIVITYANKLSKALFLLARYVNLREGFEERVWIRS